MVQTKWFKETWCKEAYTAECVYYRYWNSRFTQFTMSTVNTCISFARNAWFPNGSKTSRITDHLILSIILKPINIFENYVLCWSLSQQASKAQTALHEALFKCTSYKNNVSTNLLFNLNWKLETPSYSDVYNSWVKAENNPMHAAISPLRGRYSMFVNRGNRSQTSWSYGRLKSQQCLRKSSYFWNWLAEYEEEHLYGKMRSCVEERPATFVDEELCRRKRSNVGRSGAMWKKDQLCSKMRSCVKERAAIWEHEELCWRKSSYLGRWETV